MVRGNVVEKLQRSSAESSDFGDRIAVPGYIDIHTHGINGIDSYDLNKNDLTEWSMALLERGTTAFVPTLVSAPRGIVKNFLAAVSETMGTEKGAEIIGGRLEGPFISKEKKGAHDPLLLKIPIETSYREWLSDSGNALKILDIAPELEGAMDMISDLSNNGTVVSMGHTDCDFNTARDGFDKGARLVTHFYNAMRGFNHRSPSLMDFAFLEKRISIELICDLVHISSEALNIAIRNKGPGKVILVTDSIHATGMPDGKYKLGNLEIGKNGNRCTIANTDILAGSVLTLDKAVQNLSKLGYRLQSIVRMTSTNPAKILGIRKLGRIKEGNNANVTILDKSLKVKGVLMNGRLLEF